MHTGVSVKAGAAFLAGVVLALGGAFTYFKVADAPPPPVEKPVQEAVVAKSVVPDLTSPPKPVDITPVVPVMPVVAKPKPVPTKVATAKIVPPPRLILPKARITSRPVSLAMANPKPIEVQVPATPPPSLTPALAPVPVVAAQVPEPQVQAPPPPPQPHTVTIPAGTSLAIRLNEKLSTDHNYTGDTFRATLETPVVVEGFIIADRGAKVLGRIVKAQKPGKLEGMAELSVALTQIATTDGQTMRITTNESLRKGASNTNEEVVKMGGGAALGAIIGAIAGGGKGSAIGAGAGGAAGTGAVLMGHGKPAVIDSETRLTFQLANPTTLTEKLN